MTSFPGPGPVRIAIRRCHRTPRRSDRNTGHAQRHRICGNTRRFSPTDHRPSPSGNIFCRTGTSTASPEEPSGKRSPRPPIPQERCIREAEPEKEPFSFGERENMRECRYENECQDPAGRSPPPTAGRLRSTAANMTRSRPASRKIEANRHTGSAWQHRTSQPVRRGNQRSHPAPSPWGTGPTLLCIHAGYRLRFPPHSPLFTLESSTEIIPITYPNPCLPAPSAVTAPSEYRPDYSSVFRGKGRYRPRGVRCGHTIVRTPFPIRPRLLPSRGNGKCGQPAGTRSADASMDTADIPPRSRNGHVYRCFGPLPGCSGSCGRPENCSVTVFDATPPPPVPSNTIFSRNAPQATRPAPSPRGSHRAPTVSPRFYS